MIRRSLVVAGLVLAVVAGLVARSAPRLAETVAAPAMPAPPVEKPPVVIPDLPAVLVRPALESAGLGYPMQLFPALDTSAELLCAAIAQEGEPPRWTESEFLPDLWECLSFREDAAGGYALFAMVRGTDALDAAEIRLKLTIDGLESTPAQERALAELAGRIGRALGPLLPDGFARAVARVESGAETAYNTGFTVIFGFDGGRGRDVVVSLPPPLRTRFAPGTWHQRGPAPLAR